MSKLNRKKRIWIERVIVGLVIAGLAVAAFRTNIQMKYTSEETEAILATGEILEAEWTYYLAHDSFSPSTKELAVTIPYLEYWVGPLLTLSSKIYRAQSKGFETKLTELLDPDEPAVTVQFICEFPKPTYVVGFLTIRGNKKIRRGILRPADMISGHLG